MDGAGASVVGARAELKHDEWRPPASAHPLMIDVMWAATTTVFIGLTATGESPYVAGNGAGPSFVVARAVLARLLAVFILVLMFLRSLPSLSYDKLLEAEERLLQTVRGRLGHHWARFRTKSCAWQIHSLVLQSGQPTPGGTRRPVAVLLHGHSSGSALWESVLDRLAGEVDLMVLDMPGWGRSPAPPSLLSCHSPSTVTDLHVEMLEGWLQSFGLADRRIILIGHSLGGYFASAFAQLHPHHVEQLILISPGGLAPIMPEGAFVWGSYFRFWPPQRIARVLGRVGYVLFTAAYGMATTEDPRFVPYYYLLAYNTTMTGKGDRPAASFLRYTLGGALFWATPCLSDLMRFKGKLSIVWGQKDEMIPPLQGALLHRIRPDTDLYYIKGGLHNPAHTNARATCDALLDAILKHRGKPRVSMVGRGDGRGFDAGDADRMLEATAHASTGVLQAGVYPASPATAPREEEGSTPPSPLVLAHGRALPDSLRSLDVSQASVDEVASASPSSGYGSRSLPSFDEPAQSSDEDEERQDERDATGEKFVGASMAAGQASASSVTASAASSGADVISSEIGRGRGHCNNCLHAVHLYKSYWRCSCAAWSFNAHISGLKTRRHFEAFLTFLDELYVLGTFNARTSKSIVMYLRPRTPLPPPPNSSTTGHHYANGHGHGSHGHAHLGLWDRATQPLWKAVREAGSAVNDTMTMAIVGVQSLLAMEAQQAGPEQVIVEGVEQEDQVAPDCHGDMTSGMEQPQAPPENQASGSSSGVASSTMYRISSRDQLEADGGANGNGRGLQFRGQQPQGVATGQEGPRPGVLAWPLPLPVPQPVQGHHLRPAPAVFHRGDVFLLD